jgi:hypothetical protein
MDGDRTLASVVASSGRVKKDVTAEQFVRWVYGAARASVIAIDADAVGLAPVVASGDQATAGVPRDAVIADEFIRTIEFGYLLARYGRSQDARPSPYPASSTATAHERNIVERAWRAEWSQWRDGLAEVAEYFETHPGMLAEHAVSTIGVPEQPPRRAILAH